MKGNEFSYWRGYLQVYIESLYPERFFNICSAHQIRLWKLQSKEEGYLCFIKREDFKRLLSIVKKTKTRIRIRKRYGFPVFLCKIKRYKAWLVGFFFFFVVLWYGMTHIWTIQFEGNQIYSTDILKDFIEENGVYCGVKTKQVSCSMIESLLREQYEDITWVSASVDGSCLYIKIQENRKDEKYEIEKGQGKNLIAQDAGIIVQMITRAGTPVVKVGDVVERGQVLVSGEVQVLDDYNALIRTEYVDADADVVALVTKTYSESEKLTYQEKIYTGKHKKAYSICFGKKRFYLWAWPVSYQSYDSICEKQSVSELDGFDEIALECWNYREYQLSKGVYTKEEALEKMKEKVETDFQDYIEKGLHF